MPAGRAVAFALVTFASAAMTGGWRAAEAKETRGQVMAPVTPASSTNDDAWFAAVKHYGMQQGLGAYAKRVFRTTSGRYYVPDEDDRRVILELRSNAALVARLTSRKPAARPAVTSQSDAGSWHARVAVAGPAALAPAARAGPRSAGAPSLRGTLTGEIFADGTGLAAAAVRSPVRPMGLGGSR